MEPLLCHTQAFQLAWLDGQSGTFPIHVPAFTQTVFILFMCYSVQFTQIFELNLNEKRVGGGVGGGGGGELTDLNKQGKTEAVFACMRKTQGKCLICIANNNKKNAC